MTPEKSPVIATSAKTDHVKFYLAASVLVSGFLFFIDEGYFSFRWMLDLGSWIIFSVYVLALFMGQFLIHTCIPHRYSIKQKRVFALVLGIPAGLCVLALALSN
ncbi:MAG: hypothetical protein KF845_01225 [Cyclobacteriaceae bacterium]|nr:hypothetical protein [Cyclobacteriaceae bacterium]